MELNWWKLRLLQ